MSKYLWLPGQGTDHPSAPSISAYDITGDLEIEAWAIIDDYGTSNAKHLLRKGLSGDRQWSFYIQSNTLRFQWSPNGSTLNTHTMGSIGAFTPGVLRGFRVELDKDDGAGNAVGTAYITDDNGDWVNVGSGNVADTSPLFTGTGTITHGVNFGSTGYPYGFVRGIVRDGIGGPIVYDARFDQLTVEELAARQFVEDSSNANTVTLNGDAWTYVSPITSGLLARAEAIYQADDGNNGVTPEWADRSGNDHHARLGSVAGVDANDPKFFDHDSGNYARLPGLNDNNVSTDDKAALDLTGDFSIESDVVVDDVDAAGTHQLASKYAANLGYQHRLIGDAWSLVVGDGAASTFTCSVATSSFLSDGERVVLRVDFDADTGGGQHSARFWYSKDNRQTWTEAGVEQFNAGTFTMGTHSLGLFLGASVSNLEPLAGKLYGFRLYSDLARTTLVADLNVNAWLDPASTYTDPQGNVWTVNRLGTAEVARIVDRPHWWLDTDDYFEITDHPDLNFQLADDATLAWAGRIYSADILMALYSKKAGAGTGIGWALFTNVGLQVRSRFSDGTNAPLDVASPYTPEAPMTVIGVRNTIDDDVETFLDGVGSGSPSADTTVATLENAFNPRIGRQADTGTNYYGPGEVFSVALFREALTDEEIAELSDQLLGIGGGDILMVGVG